MTDLAEAPVSTVLDAEPAESPTGGGIPKLTEDKPSSLRDDIEAAMREDAKPEPEKKDAPPKQPEKVEAKPKAEPEADAKTEEKKSNADVDADGAGKSAAKDAAPTTDERDAAADPKTEDRPETNFKGAPKRFLPDSHEVWRNVPRAVRRDIETMEREHTQQVEQFREVGERYSRLRDFDEMAKSNGRDLRESLMQVHQFENAMRENPVAALNMALLQVGPRKPDGQPVSLYEIAQHIVQQGQEGYQRMVAQPQTRQQPQQDPRVEQLERELGEIKAQQIAASVIEPFKAKHPRYDELQDDIALFLESGKVPASLSPQERLAAAYDMAARINPASHVTPAPANEDKGPDPTRRADDDFSGSKSIKSSPGSVTESVDDLAKSGESTRDSILAEMRRMKR